MQRTLVLTILLTAASLTADDGVACPACGASDVRFENSPEGVFRKFLGAVLLGDRAKIESCVSGMDDDSLDKLADTKRPKSLDILRGRVTSALVNDATTGQVTFATGLDPVRTIDAICKEGTWRLDFGSRIRRELKLKPHPALALEELVEAESMWRVYNGEETGVLVYWTLDVAGFALGTDTDTPPYIRPEIARADRAGLGLYSKEAPQPFEGYWIRTMLRDSSGKPYALDPDGDGVASTNPTGYAFCAYPAEYGTSGTLTYIVNEKREVLSKDLGPEDKDGIDRWPGEDAEEHGWRAGAEGGHEKPDCPICGNAEAVFEDSPKGAFARLRFGLILGNPDRIRECLLDADEAAARSLCAKDGPAGDFLAMSPDGIGIEGDRGTVTATTHLGVKVEISAVRVEEAWKLDGAVLLSIATKLRQIDACKGNLRQFGVYISMHMSRFGEGRTYPGPGLKLLTDLYTLPDPSQSVLGGNLDIFICEAAGDETSAALVEKGDPECTSYECFQGQVTPETPPETPIVWDKRPVHDGKRNVLLFNGTARTMTEEEFKAARGD